MEVDLVKKTKPVNEEISSRPKIDIDDEEDFDPNEDFICDFVVVDEYLYYTVGAGVACITLKERSDSEKFEYHNMRLVERIGEGSFFSSMVADRRRKNIIIMNESDSVVVYDIIQENGSLVKKKEIQLNPQPSMKDSKKQYSNSYSGTVVCEHREILVTGVEYSETSKSEGEVYMVQKYATSSFPKVTRLFNYKEDVKALEFLKTRKNWLVIGGGVLRGIPGPRKVPEFATFVIFDFSIMEVVAKSVEGVHTKQIRDIKTFIRKRSSNNISQFEEEEEEMIASCCNGGVVGIFNLEGLKIFSHDLKEILCSLFVVNNTNLLVGGNWGGLHALNITSDISEDESASFETKKFFSRDTDRNSTTHVGICGWIGRTNFFFGTHGDCILRLYEVKNTERVFYDDRYFFPDFMDEDEKERMEFLITPENMKMCGIKEFRVDFKGKSHTESLELPYFLYYISLS